MCKKSITAYDILSKERIFHVKFCLDGDLITVKVDGDHILAYSCKWIAKFNPKVTSEINEADVKKVGFDIAYIVGINGTYYIRSWDKLYQL